MKLTIDNLDGSGVLDYSGAVLAHPPITITRRLNQPTICSFALLLSGTSLETPLRYARVTVTDTAGIVLFTGYIAREPAAGYAGAGIANNIFTFSISAISEEMLLDREAVPQTRAVAGQTVGQLVSALTTRVDGGRLSLTTGGAIAPVGHFRPAPGRSWSENVAELAAMTRSAYSVRNGVVTVAPIGTVTHAFSEADGTLQISALQTAMVKMLVNDVTVCGAEEPGAYVTEIFQGDGTTAVFPLTRLPYFPSASYSKPLSDSFQEAAIDPVLWRVADAGSHVSLTAAGLTLSGGDGGDGHTTVTAIDPLEIGGALVIEAGGVQFGASTAGVLSGLYQGAVLAANCVAGFVVAQVSGATAISALVQGTTVGTSYAPLAGHQYTLRIRTYSRDVQRVMASYYAYGDGGEVSFGGQVVPADVAIVIEVQDTTAGASVTATVLYDGVIADAPSVLNFAPVNSSNLVGSIASVSVTNAAAVWASSRTGASPAQTRRLGSALAGAEARIERTGVLHFYPGFIPAASETVTVTYRLAHRSVARMADAASIAEEGNATIPGISKWVGTVSMPVARSSADCENAALALLTLGTSRAAAWAGRYMAYNQQATADVWPGDALAVIAASLGLTATLVVREVEIEAGSSSPDAVKYSMTFANDWADALSMRLSAEVPEDAWLPQTASLAVTALPSLTELAVGSVTGSAIQIVAGASPAAGGGFEVRRSDWHFGPGNDAGLVLRSSAASFSIPRGSAIEQYYVRQYDASTPPNYSRFSAAVFVNVAL